MWKLKNLMGVCFQGQGVKVLVDPVTLVPPREGWSPEVLVGGDAGVCAEEANFFLGVGLDGGDVSVCGVWW